MRTALVLVVAALVACATAQLKLFRENVTATPCSTKNSYDDSCTCGYSFDSADCACQAGMPCKCSGQADEGRCLCGAASSCDCGSQDCYCGSAGSCTGTGNMFCAATAGRGDANCKWNKERYSFSNEDAALFCVPDDTAFAKLPTCLQSDNVTHACLAQYACKNGTALTLANHPEIAIIPAMIGLNMLVFGVVLACMLPKHYYFMKVHTEANPLLGKGMQNRTEASNSSYLAFLYAVLPFFCCTAIIILNAKIYLLIPAGVSCCILQFFGRNSIEFEPAKNRVSYYKYFCLCIPFLTARDQMDNLYSNTQYTFAFRAKNWTITINRKNGKPPLNLPLNGCPCDCMPTDWRKEMQDRIRDYLKEYLAPLEAGAPPPEPTNLFPADPLLGALFTPATRANQPAVIYVQPTATPYAPPPTNPAAGAPPAYAPPPYDPGMGAGATPTSNQPVPGVSKFCSACGTKQNAGARFCNNCGTAIHYD